MSLVAIKIFDSQQLSKVDCVIQGLKKDVYENIWNEPALPFKVFQTVLCFAGDIFVGGNHIVMPEVLEQSTLYNWLTKVIQACPL